MKPLTSYEVLTAWLENESGVVQVKPEGFSNATSSGSHKETCRIAAQIVQAQPMYGMIRFRLLDWVTANFPSGDEVYQLCQCFEHELGKWLLLNPFYPVRNIEMDEASRTSIVWRTVESVAEEINQKPNTLRKRLDRRKTALPFGSFTDDKRAWNLHPLDVSEIKSMFMETEEVA